ncbi:MAG: ABC transporter ATP-binding protein [Actinomycetota bacterium]|nr:ABC transporter ATP-binding protein [Actinomycetota bacterium]
MMVQRRLAGLAREAPGRVGLTLAAGLGAAACSIGQGLATGLIVRDVLEGASADELTGLVAVIAALVVARSALLWFRDLAAHWASAKVKAGLRHRLYAKLLDLGPGYAATRGTGKVQATVVDGVEALQAYVGFYLPQAVVAVAAPLALAGFLVALDPVVGAVVVVSCALVPLARPMWTRTLGRTGQRHWDAYEHLSARMLDALQGITTLKLLNASDRRGRAIQADSADLYRATIANLRSSLGIYVVTATVFGVGTAMAAAFGALRFAGGSLSAGELLLVLFLAGECFKPLVELQNYWHEGFYGMAAAGGIFELLDAEPLVTDPDEPVAPPTDQRPDIVFDDVTFTYPAAASAALTGLSAVAPGGRTTAVVGRSGSGKSTLVNLLLRLFDPDEGAVRIGGIDVADMRLADVRSLTTIVSQDIYLFAGTIRENLLVARPGATDAELADAIDAAGATELIDRLPGGLDAPVGERGSTLSGGERQRVAIARALLADAPILVLDEATSSVDGENEAHIQAALGRISEGRTVLVIAHRLSTIAAADQVLVLDGGHLAEVGGGAELLASGGRYAELVAAQRSA